MRKRAASTFGRARERERRSRPLPLAGGLCFINLNGRRGAHETQILRDAQDDSGTVDGYMKHALIQAVRNSS
jgi:hypothetical protein